MVNCLPRIFIILWAQCSCCSDLLLGIESQWGEIFHTCPDRPWVQPSLLCNRYWVSFPGVEQLGHGVDQLPPPSTKVKERMSYTSLSPLGLHGLF